MGGGAGAEWGEVRCTESWIMQLTWDRKADAARVSTCRPDTADGRDSAGQGAAPSARGAAHPSARRTGNSREQPSTHKHEVDHGLHIGGHAKVLVIVACTGYQE